MAWEVFLIAVIFWLSILVLYAFLSRRLARLAERISDLEKGGGKE